MDPLYFRTESKEQFLTALRLHEDPSLEDGKFFNGIYEEPDFIAAWIGKIPATYKTVETEEGSMEVVDTYQHGYYFNIWVKGQEAMDRFIQLPGSKLMPAPNTPNLKLF